MNYLSRVVSVLVVAVLATTAPIARSRGTGGAGGHGGPGGHGGGGHSSGGHGGHASGRSSSGHSSGHSAAHSAGNPFGRLFGHRGKESKVPPSQNVELVPRPFPNRFRHRPPTRLAFGHPVGFFPHRRHFGFAGCPAFGFPGNNFFFGDRFDCFNNGFFFDSFFFGEFSSSLFYGPAFDNPDWFTGSTNPGVMNDSGQEPASPDSYLTAQPRNEPSGSAETTSPSESEPAIQPPVTLLQLRNGLMYGLTDYWIEAGELHYKTTYGGQNSLPLDQIDLEKTIQLNADRGVPFLLHPKPAS